MASAFTPFPVDSDGCRLMARSYAPAAPAFPGAAVFLLHGYLSSADMFDVPGREEMSLARALQREGIHVITYDQRGAGESVVENWAFGFREHALVDLPKVIAAGTRAFGLDRIVLAGHSLGGTIWLRYLQARLAGGNGVRDLQSLASLPRVVAGIALASPAFFDVALKPWSDFARRGRRFVESIDADGNQIVGRAEFTAAQALLYWRCATPLFRPRIVDIISRLGTKSPLLAGAVRILPIPTLVYHWQDFDNVSFMHVLRSRVLHQASQQLLLEIFDEIGPAPPAPPTPIDLDALCIGSTADRLVPLGSVEGFSRAFRHARVVATEHEYGVSSGHAGYFFKDGVRDRVFSEVSGYLRSRLAD